MLCPEALKLFSTTVAPWTGLLFAALVTVTTYVWETASRGRGVMLIARFPGIGTIAGPSKSPTTSRAATPEPVIVGVNAETTAVGVNSFPKLASVVPTCDAIAPLIPDSMPDTIWATRKGATTEETKSGTPVAFKVEAVAVTLKTRPVFKGSLDGPRTSVTVSANVWVILLTTNCLTTSVPVTANPMEPGPHPVGLAAGGAVPLPIMGLRGINIPPDAAPAAPPIAFGTLTVSGVGISLATRPARSDAEIVTTGAVKIVNGAGDGGSVLRPPDRNKSPSTG